MTCLKYMERGVDKEIEDICGHCDSFSGWVMDRPLPLKRLSIGICRNDKSNHYLHMFSFFHPACKQFERA